MTLGEKKHKREALGVTEEPERGCGIHSGTKAYLYHPTVDDTRRKKHKREALGVTEEPERGCGIHSSTKAYRYHPTVDDTRRKEA